MTFRAFMLAFFCAPGEAASYYVAVRKRRHRCPTCHHRHGATRNGPPTKCRAVGCGCSDMLAWSWTDAPWLRSDARPVLDLCRARGEMRRPPPNATPAEAP